MKYTILLLMAVCCSCMLKAQVTTNIPIDTAKQHTHGRNTLTVGSGGVRVYDKYDSISHTFEVQYGMLDLGINSLLDHTDYNTAAASAFLRVDAAHTNGDLFSLRQSKSINVNIYPVMVKARLYKSARQKIILASGLGLQLYNFRFTKPVSYTADPTPGVMLDTVSFSKNKLAFNYLTVPLMIIGKTRIAPGGVNHSGNWLTYGAGVSGGYLLSSWTKQISDQRGKEKNHDPFNFRNTNLCVNAELGLEGVIRLYASYQLTSLHEDALDQHPFCIGLRFLGL